MRGALRGIFGRGDRKGIIPADAGSTSLYVGTAPEIRDHPRGCGEHAERLEPIRYA